ncbi:MAG: hypothetical protein ACK6DZ_11650 [Acidobacteriota bacterium]
MNKTQGVFLWMMFLLAANTGVILTLLRERIVFRRFRDEISGFLPPGYDPKRLDYPYLFSFTTPPAWSRALAVHRQRHPEHPYRTSWDRFVAIRRVLMLGELLTLAAFVLWMLFG